MKKVVITNLAKEKLEHLFQYLITHWSYKVKTDFVKKLDRCIHQIQQQPKSFPESTTNKGLYKCVVTKQTIMYYRFTNTHIYIITIFDSRQHPKQLKKDLK